MRNVIRLTSIACMLALSLHTNAQMTSPKGEAEDWVRKQVASGMSQREIQKSLEEKGLSTEEIRTIWLNIQTEDKETRDKRLTYPIDGPDPLGAERVEPGNKLMEGEEIHQKTDSLPDPKEQIFGQSLFNNREMTFEPNDQIPAPASYRLGPGDRLRVTIYGENQSLLTSDIQPDGNFLVQDLGPVALTGLTVKEAEKALSAALSAIYGGLIDGSTGLTLTAFRGRSVRVHVMGEVKTPGTYTLSAYASVFHAIYRAGGLSDLSGLRAIQIVRKGEPSVTLDVYGYIFKGTLPDIESLEDGDVVIVPTYDRLVKATGAVKRPMYYEMTEEESLSDLLSYAGGLEAKAYRKQFSIERQEDEGIRICSVTEEEASAFPLRNGDVLTVREADDRYQNRIEVRGAVRHPGFFELSPEINTVKLLIEQAEGVREDAFLGRSVLYRRRTDETREAKAIALGDELSGKNRTELRNGDLLFIPSVQDIKERTTVEIQGAVGKPGVYTYLEHQTLEDLVLQAGGLKESASMVRVDVARRVSRGMDSDTISTTYSFGLKEGLVVDGTPGFELKPFDQVFVRHNPGYTEQQNITISGEVLYDGTYALTNKNQRLSQIVEQAGGLTRHAYAGGARLIRRANDIEKKQMEQVIELINKELGASVTDSLQLEVDTLIQVGIDLERALAYPESEDNIVLREGDELYIPQLDNTVKIDGGVMFPNTVAFDSRMRVKDYINQAGGFASAAHKRGVFVVYMNGKVDKVSSSSRDKIKPGCRIIVPLKSRKSNLANTLAAISSISSIGMMVATMANLIKK